MNTFCEEKFYNCKYDVVFKNVVACEEGKSILKAVIEDALKIKIDKLEIINAESKTTTLAKKGKITDCLVETSDSIINVEVNTSSDRSLRDWNTISFMKKYINLCKYGKAYNKAILSIQLNFDWNANYNKVKNVYMLMEKNSGKMYVDNLKVYTFDMDKLLEMSYTEDKKEIEYKYITMLAINNASKLKEYCTGDDVMEKYSNDVINLNSDDKYKDMIIAEQDIEMICEARMAYAKEEGEKEKTIKIAKNMLAYNLDIDIISKTTGLSKEEIEKIDSQN